MRKRLSIVAVACFAAAGCSGGGDEQATTTPTATTPAGPVVEFIDGDTQQPVAEARVVAFDLASRETVHTSGSDGRVTVPEGTASVRADKAGHTVGSGHISGPTTTLRMYQTARQSPEYGGGPARTRYLPAVDLPPPGKRAPKWTFESRTLIEFPPAVSQGVAVVGVNSGRVYALNTTTGKVLWARRQGGLIASSPAIDWPRVYVTSMDGAFTSYRINDGRRMYSFDAGGSPIETSPLLVDGRAYFGTWAGTVYALNLKSGKPQWTFQADADVKGSAAFTGRHVVFGDYRGNLYAVDPASGKLAWRYSGGQRFYGGPGFSDGTLVVGDVGGSVIAVDAATGREKWRHRTGSYVYASPAIADGTVYIGNYGGTFEALDLATGERRWSFNAGGRISGSATVVGDTVYTSTISRPGEPKRTYGLNIANGKEVFRKDDGRYSPAVAAGRTLFLVGVRHIYAYPSPAR